METLPSEELKPYLDFLLDRSTCFNAWMQPSYDLTMRLPRSWLIENVETEAEVLLTKINDDQIYKWLLMLYEQLDSDLAERLAHRALAHLDKEEGEIGQEYFDKINDDQN